MQSPSQVQVQDTSSHGYWNTSVRTYFVEVPLRYFELSTVRRTVRTSTGVPVCTTTVYNLQYKYTLYSTSTGKALLIQ